MNRARYLSMMAMLLWCSMAVRGQDDFNPESPAEPDAPDIKTALVLTATPSEGGSVSGGGKYSAGEQLYVSATDYSPYVFSHWTDAQGNVISTERVYYFTKGAKVENLTAHFTFAPDSPNEPDDPNTILYHRLTTRAMVGGTASGGGRFRMGTTVTVYAYPDQYFYFSCWTDKDGNVVSTDASFTYTMKAYSDVLTANFVFNPDSPDEPNEAIVRRRVSVQCGEGGGYGGETGRILQGNSITLNAYANTDYDFLGWYLNGELYTTLSSFSYTVGAENADFYAMFKFNPSSPDEPLQPALDLYNFYLMTKNGTPGSQISFPLYLASTVPVGDMTFNLKFPTAMMPSLEDIHVSELAQGYNLSLTPVNDSVFVFSMIGGHTEACTTQFLTFTIDVDENIKPGSSWQVKINQISLTQEDGTTVTAHTRNGRLGVYAWGDASLDGVVDGVDSRLIINDWLGAGNDALDMDVSDIVNDGNLDAQDSRAIINTWLNAPEEENNEDDENPNSPIPD